MVLETIHILLTARDMAAATDNTPTVPRPVALIQRPILRTFATNNTDNSISTTIGSFR